VSCAEPGQRGPSSHRRCRVVDAHHERRRRLDDEASNSRLRHGRRGRGALPSSPPESRVHRVRAVPRDVRAELLTVPDVPLHGQGRGSHEAPSVSAKVRGTLLLSGSPLTLTIPTCDLHRHLVAHRGGRSQVGTGRRHARYRTERVAGGATWSMAVVSPGSATPARSRGARPPRGDTGRVRNREPLPPTSAGRRRASAGRC
jgi:hypothetical protein